MGRKIHSPTSKRDAFHPQKQALLRTRLEGEFDFTSSPYDPLPRKCVGRAGAKKPRHRPVIQRVSCSRGHLSVGSDAAFWDGTNSPAKCGISNLVRPGSILCDSPNEFP